VSCLRWARSAHSATGSGDSVLSTVLLPPSPSSPYRRHRESLRRHAVVAVSVAGKAQDPTNKTTSRGIPRRGLKNAQTHPLMKGYPPWYDLDWSKPGNHFKLFLLHSWSALLLALCVLIYTSWSSLSSTDVPLFVRFTLYKLLVTYSLFGVFANICYAAAGKIG
jgi:hypothetical protein